jgi:hypothetical protein
MTAVQVFEGDGVDRNNPLMVLEDIIARDSFTFSLMIDREGADRIPWRHTISRDDVRSTLESLAFRAEDIRYLTTKAVEDEVNRQEFAMKRKQVVTSRAPVTASNKTFTAVLYAVVSR